MNQYIQERYNRKKMRSRISLGVQILIQKPVINLLWVVLVACVLAVVYGEGKFMSIYESESFLREVMDVVLRIVNVVVTIAFILAIIESIYSMLMPKELIERVGNREFHTGEGVMLWQGSELKFIKVPVIRDEEKMKAICVEALTR